MTDAPDIVIVGGGIAGCSLALATARAGARVTVLERRERYEDAVRGELIWPWGVSSARALGVEQVLLDAEGLVVPWFDAADEGAPTVRLDSGAVVAGVAGSLNITHPAACQALAAAAREAGADVQVGVRAVKVTTGPRPAIAWTDRRGHAHEASPDIVVGADGRRSTVRAQAGIPLSVGPVEHLVAGVLVQAIPQLDTGVNLVARAADVGFYAFPEDDGRARLYRFFPTGQRLRFAGPDGAHAFLAACGTSPVERIAEWSTSTPAGPCATFTAESSRTATPLAQGVVLVGDAAGYENPVLGQGLSMALADVLDVARALTASDEGRIGALDRYAEQRARRKHMTGLATTLEVWANDAFTIQEPGVRRRRYAAIAADALLRDLQATYAAGFAALPATVPDELFRDRLAAAR